MWQHIDTCKKNHDYLKKRENAQVKFCQELKQFLEMKDKSQDIKTLFDKPDYEILHPKTSNLRFLCPALRSLL